MTPEDYITASACQRSLAERLADAARRLMLAGREDDAEVAFRCAVRRSARARELLARSVRLTREQAAGLRGAE